MVIVLLIGITGALGLAALGLGLAVLVPPLPAQRTAQYGRGLMSPQPRPDIHRHAYTWQRTRTWTSCIEHLLRLLGLSGTIHQKGG
jgi:hypothetical protein